jgi:hypothetical protein
MAKPPSRLRSTETYARPRSVPHGLVRLRMGLDPLRSLAGVLERKRRISDRTLRLGGDPQLTIGAVAPSMAKVLIKKCLQMTSWPSYGRRLQCWTILKHRPLTHALRHGDPLLGRRLYRSCGFSRWKAVRGIDGKEWRRSTSVLPHVSAARRVYRLDGRSPLQIAGCAAGALRGPTFHHAGGAGGAMMPRDGSNRDFPEQPILISRPDAVRLSGVCGNTFDRHVRPHLGVRRIGRAVFFVRKELIQWLENGGTDSASKQIRETGSSSADSRTTAKTSRSRRGREIERKLKSSQRSSIRKPYPVGGG